MRTFRAPKNRKSVENVAALSFVGLLFLWILSRVPSPSFETREQELSRKSPLQTADIHTIPQTPSLRLLLSTHNRLFWYYPDTQEDVPIHTGQGVYYGAFPGEPAPDSSPTIWVVSRPHNWHATTTVERLLNINTNTGSIVQEVNIPSRFTHDAVRRGDTVWLCNTGEGSLLELSYPSMAVMKSLPLFTVKEHINTVAAYDSSSVWAVLHNLGRSKVVQVDLETGDITQKFDNVGENSHGLAAWRGLFVMLSSKETSLITLDPDNGRVKYLWKADSGFLKGLIVVDDVAYFGISPPMARQNRDGPNVQCDLVAFDLLAHKQLFRHKLDTRGLLNVISAPHLSESSTFVAVQTSTSKGSISTTLPSLQSSDRQDSGRWESLPTSRWSLGWMEAPLDKAAAAGQWSTDMPRLDLGKKVKSASLGLENTAPVYMHLGKAHPQLIQPVQDALAAMPMEWWDPQVQGGVSATIADRESNLNAIKPGVETMFLIFSSRTGDRVWELPLYRHFAAVLDPLMEALIGPDSMRNILRLQLARMKPGAHIKSHRDTGPWAKLTHRIHVVIKTNPSISFFSCPKCSSARGNNAPECTAPPKGKCIALDTTLDSIFEVNNLILHEVTNTANADRIHLVADVLEDRAPERVILEPGQKCHYVSSASQPNNPGC